MPKAGMIKNSDDMRVGVVLSTGDLRGVYAHTGFMSALEKIGVRYHAIAGSSAGALVSAIVASGRRPSEMVNWLQTIKPKDYWKPDSRIQIFYHLLLRRGKGYTGLVSTERMKRSLEKNLKAKDFGDCSIPLYIVTTNITEGGKEVFNAGVIAPVAVASAAIPGLIKAVRIGQCYYVDGGVYDLTPRSAICCIEKLDVLLVHQIRSSKKKELDNSFMHEQLSILHVVGRVIESVYENNGGFQQSGISACKCGCKAVILTISPDLSPLDRLEPEKGLIIFQEAYDLAMRMVPRLLEDLRETGKRALRPKESHH